MTRYDGTPASNVSVAMNAGLTMVALIAAVVAVSFPMSDGQPHRDRDRIGRLEKFAAQQTGELADMRDRVLRLERPNEPVYPPRHPGRIGGKPVIPWIEPWSGSRPSLGTEIGSASEPTIGRTIDQ